MCNEALKTETASSMQISVRDAIDRSDSSCSKYENAQAYTAYECTENHTQTYSYGLGDDFFALVQFRRTSFIVCHDSQGFVEILAESDDHEALELEFNESIVQKHEAELDKNAWQAFPDVVTIVRPNMAENEICFDPDISCYDEQDIRDGLRAAIIELEVVIAIIGRKINAGRTIEVHETDEGYEVTDSDDAVMSDPLCGHYYVDRIDRSSDRETHIEEARA